MTRNHKKNRMTYCIDELSKIGIVAKVANPIKLEFKFKGETISFWPHTGWHSGGSIEPGRGFKNLIDKLSK